MRKSSLLPDSNGAHLAHQPTDFVIPANAGIHFQVVKINMDPGLTSHSAVESCRDDDAKSVSFRPDSQAPIG